MLQKRRYLPVKVFLQKSSETTPLRSVTRMLRGALPKPTHTIIANSYCSVFRFLQSYLSSVYGDFRPKLNQTSKDEACLHSC